MGSRHLAARSCREGVFLWIVPARVAGIWDWDVSVAGKRLRYASIIEQHFQKVEGVVRAGDRREVLEAATLRGSNIAFTLNITLDRLGLTHHEFSGKVDGDQIVGTAKLTPRDQEAVTVQWRARRERAVRLLRADRNGDVSAAGRDSVSRALVHEASHRKNVIDIGYSTPRRRPP